MYERISGETCDALIWKERAEPAATERKTIYLAEVLKRLNVTQAVLDEAIRADGFPPPTKVPRRPTMAYFINPLASPRKYDCEWFEDVIDRWVAERREKLAAQQRFVEHW